jgi:hypothetical protein
MGTKVHLIALVAGELGMRHLRVVLIDEAVDRRLASHVADRRAHGDARV